jgi:glutamyl-tRNA synthetase
MAKTRTRFAPSPTGNLHIGGLRTAAYAYALAKHEDGDFLLRIEDTDQKREVPGGREKIEEILKTFGIHWDEEYVQSERARNGVYAEVAKKLVSEGYAFYCQCEARNAKTEGFSTVLRDPCRDKKLESGAIKLRVPDGEKVLYRDLVIKKDIEWKTDDVADTTLLKSDGEFPTYHLAVVIDDTEMKITHVLRGYDWLPSTPIHLLVYKYLGYDVPQIGHLTDIQDIEGGKLSKRKGSYSCEALIVEGYLPEAIFNFIILLGWAPKDNREMFTLAEFVEHFDVNGFQKSNPVYNIQKLDWFNGQYIKNFTDEELTKRIIDVYGDKYPKDTVEKLAPLVKERMRKITDFESLAGYVFEEKEPLVLTGNAYEYLSNASVSLQNVSSWSLPSISNALMGTVSEHSYKTGEFFQGLRGGIAGSNVTPPLNDTLEIMGKEETLKRINNALRKIKEADPESSSG